MEAVEFYIINGVTCISRGGVSRRMTPQDRDVIEFMLENIGKYFPDALKALRELASASEPNRPYFEYRIVDRFIRCNFGEADFLNPDVEMNMFHFEEVKCPLRGICEHEGVICKPVPRLDISREEARVVGLYVKGFLPGEIAEKLGKAEATCKQQIWHACKRLKLPHPRWLFRLFSFYNIAMME